MVQRHHLAHRPRWQESCLFSRYREACVEVRGMSVTRRSCGSLGCPVETPVFLRQQGLCLDHYLEETFRKLAVTTAKFHRGQGTDAATIDWLRSQMDLAAELLTDDMSSLDPEQRSRLLELVLGIANLNEYIRRHDVPVHHSSSNLR
jgi:hypothetical protein